MDMKATTIITGKTAVTTEIDGFSITCEPPVSAGGTGEFPPATRLVIAALLNCIFSGFKSFCEMRSLTTEDLRMDFTGTMEEGVYQNMNLALSLPEDFPDKYKGTLENVLKTCSVKKIITNLPPINLTLQ